MKRILTAILCLLPLMSYAEFAILETKDVNFFLNRIKESGYVVYSIKESPSGQSWQINYVTQAQYDALMSMPVPGESR